MQVARSFVRARSHAPALLLALAVAVGQAGAWFLPVVHAAGVACLVSLLSMTRCRRMEPFLSGVLVGLLTGVIGGAVHTPAGANLDRSILLRVESPPRRPKPDQIVFVGRDLLSESRSLLRCTAVELPWRNSSEVREGSVVWVRGAVMPVHRPLNPFSWDGWLWRNGISGTVKVRYVSIPLEQSVSRTEYARDYVASAIRRVGDDRRGGELLLSMAFGYRDVLSRPVEDAFTALGLKHLLVVSGYQVSLVFAVFSGLVNALMRWIRLARGAREVATVCALSGAVVFVVFIGFEMSALRALVAAACVCATTVFECSGRFAQRWGVALLMVELLSPWALFDVGVQLTFAALAGIGIGARLGQGSIVKSFAWITASAWLMTSTVVVAWNGTLSVAGLLLNLTVAAPWSFLNCVVGGAGVVLLLLVEQLGVQVVLLVEWLNEWIASAVLSLATSPVQAVVLEGHSRVVAVVLGVVLVSLLGWRASRRSPALALLAR